MERQEKEDLLELMRRILVNGQIVLNMNDEGKAYHCHNKIVGLIDQLNLLAKKVQSLPPLDVTQPPFDE